MIRYLSELSLEAFIEAARNVPYQQINSDLFPGIDLWIRRDDLIDPLISGNKAYKLIYNLLEARAQGKNTIVTCGGAWSNHLHATAAAGQRFGFKTVGIIRGERPPVLSAMLQDAERFGMELRFVSRAEYRKRYDPSFLALVGQKLDNSWFVPEGGANIQGARGVQILGRSINEVSPTRFDEYWLACGTGLTLGALAAVLPGDCTVYGVPVLKAERAIRGDALDWAQRLSSHHCKIKLIEGAHCGGYAKVDTRLAKFIETSGSLLAVPLDRVYGAKVALQLNLAGGLSGPASERVRKERRVLMIHTGGLQGERGSVDFQPVSTINVQSL
ncbi:1-aminocyclopropane-1-carboxylate deaminase/D-cysteine desulfhydrase [Microbulbifer sp. ALW1]|uniref:1-aminocyclopropane-1-carboxylate deaminase/D-cysteine desulfhydrase n=1 Tax=Microbulbifer sp. (strain ALW1) TaxID=1516059 RepID=UPI00135ADCDE|nr:pyridoxal-phosphate dependent enzyme [Microbulbifer sp. ALW1]